MESSDEPTIEETLSSLYGSCLSLCFSPNQTKLCSAGGGGCVYLTDFHTRQELKKLRGHHGNIYGSSFSSNGNLLATASVDQTVRIWNIFDLHSLNNPSSKLMGHTNEVLCVKFFQDDESKVVSGSGDRTIKIWDIEKGKVISTLFGSSGVVHSIDCIGDYTVVSGDGNHKLRVWDLRSEKCFHVLHHHKREVRSVHSHPQTFSLASGSEDKTIKITDFRNFKILQNYRHSHWVFSVCFHPSGKLLASGSMDRSVNIFDISSKKVLYLGLRKHSGAVFCVKFSPDGNYFVSGSEDSKVLVWNFPLGRKMFISELDETERVKYILDDDLSMDDEDLENSLGRSRVSKIRICGYLTIPCYKSFLLL